MITFPCKKLHNKYLILTTIGLLMLNFFLVLPMPSSQATATNNKKNTTAAEITWSDDKIDQNDTFVVTPPSPYDTDYYAGQISLTFSNVRRAKETYAVENEFTGASYAIPHENMLAMSFTLAERTKIFGFKILIHGIGNKTYDYNLTLTIFETNATTGFPSNTRWNQSNLISGQANYFGLHYLPLETGGTAAPQTLAAGKYYLALKHNYVYSNEYVSWGFFHDQPSYPNDANTDNKDEGTALRYNQTAGWTLLKIHESYGINLNQTDVPVDFVLFIEREEYILPTTSFLSANNSLAVDIGVGFGYIDINGPIISLANKSFIFNITTRIDIIFDVNILITFRNILIKLFTFPSQIIANENKEFSIQVNKYPSNQAFTNQLIRITLNKQTIDSKATDANGKLQTTVKFSIEGMNQLEFIFEGDTQGNTEGVLELPVLVKAPIPPLSLITIAAICFAALLLLVMGALIWRLYYGGWIAPDPYQVFVIYKTGLNIIERKYAVGQQDIDAQLVSGLLSAITSFTDIIAVDPSVKDNLKSIEKGQLTMQLEFGNRIIVACILEHESYYIRRKIKKILKQFEKVYHEELADWLGDTTPFEKAPELIDRYFKAKPVTMAAQSH